MRRIRLTRGMAVLCVAAAALSVAACSGGGETAKATTTAGAGAAKAGGGAAATGKTVEIAVSMKDNLFEPKDIKVKAGDTISFVAKNDGIAIHNMMIQSSTTEGKDFASAAAVNPGDTSKFTATFAKKGTVKFICAYHLPDMAGTITVE